MICFILHHRLFVAAVTLLLVRIHEKTHAVCPLLIYPPELTTSVPVDVLTAARLETLISDAVTELAANSVEVIVFEAI